MSLIVHVIISYYILMYISYDSVYINLELSTARSLLARKHNNYGILSVITIRLLK